MKNHIKILSVLFVTVVMSACAPKKIELDRTQFSNQKVSTIELKEIKENISIELSDSASESGAAVGGLLGVLVGAAIDSGVNSSRKGKFKAIQDSVSEIDANAILKEALQGKLVGNAFSEDLELVAFDKKNKKPYLTPKVTPSIIMSANYGVVNVLLSSTLNQNNIERKRPYLGIYSSQQLNEAESLEVDKGSNYKYWIDNPETLKDKIINGLNDVAQQFADDYNGVNLYAENNDTIVAEVSESPSSSTN